VRDLVFLVFGQFLVSLLVALAALCAFVWAAASGLLRDVERVKYQVLDVEHGDGEPRAGGRDDRRA